MSARQVLELREASRSQSESSEVALLKEEVDLLKKEVVLVGERVDDEDAVASEAGVMYELSAAYRFCDGRAPPTYGGRGRCRHRERAREKSLGNVRFCPSPK